MEKSSKVYRAYINILHKELVPAMGCTEPIAIAYAAATARDALGAEPERMRILCSGNIIKNVKSVVVPNSNGHKGIETAAVLGACFGSAERKLEVIAGVSEEQSAGLEDKLNAIRAEVRPLESEHILDIEIHAYAGDDEVVVRLWDTHANIVYVKRNNATIYENAAESECEFDECDYELLNIEDIFDFTNSVDLDDVREVLNRQISCNMAIAEEGIKNGYGARIGQVLLKRDLRTANKAKAYAAAASDARMGGCDMPVVINSGSGNQGITTSVPVVIYGRDEGKNEGEILRAVLFSNLVTLRLKTGIGRLSSYCGAVSAGVGAGAGIAYLLTGDLRIINHTIVNAIAITSGIVCDGAKASCAAKIAMSVESGILGYEMIMDGSQLRGGEGLVSKGVENTINNISRLGHDGMRETDKEIIAIMTGCR